MGEYSLSCVAPFMNVWHNFVCIFFQDFVLCPSPEKGLTDEEKAILEILGPAPEINLELATPPGFKPTILTCQPQSNVDLNK